MICGTADVTDSRHNSLLSTATEKHGSSIGKVSPICKAYLGSKLNCCGMAVI